MIARVCSVCGALSDRYRCPAHRRDDGRPSSVERGYDSTWAKIRKRYLREHTTCEEALCSRPSTDVHHRDDRGPTGDNSDENLEALCHSHHSRRTALEHGFGGAT